MTYRNYCRECGHTWKSVHPDQKCPKRKCGSSLTECEPVRPSLAPTDLDDLEIEE